VSDYGTPHVGVRREGREWETFDRITDSRIGLPHATMREALAYAEHREETTYAITPDCDLHGATCPEGKR